MVGVFLWLYNITIKKTCQATKYDRILPFITVFHTFHTRASPARHIFFARILGIFHLLHRAVRCGKSNLLWILHFSASHNRRRWFLFYFNKGALRRSIEVNLIYRAYWLRLPVQPLGTCFSVCILHKLRARFSTSLTQRKFSG